MFNFGLERLLSPAKERADHFLKQEEERQSKLAWMPVESCISTVTNRNSKIIKNLKDSNFHLYHFAHSWSSFASRGVLH